MLSSSSSAFTRIRPADEKFTLVELNESFRFHCSQVLACDLDETLFYFEKSWAEGRVCLKNEEDIHEMLCKAKESGIKIVIVTARKFEEQKDAPASVSVESVINALGKDLFSA